MPWSDPPLWSGLTWWAVPWCWGPGQTGQTGSLPGGGGGRDLPAVRTSSQWFMRSGQTRVLYRGEDTCIPGRATPASPVRSHVTTPLSFRVRKSEIKKNMFVSFMVNLAYIYYNNITSEELTSRGSFLYNLFLSIFSLGKIVSSEFPSLIRNRKSTGTIFLKPLKGILWMFFFCPF